MSTQKIMFPITITISPNIMLNVENSETLMRFVNEENCTCQSNRKIKSEVTTVIHVQENANSK